MGKGLGNNFFGPAQDFQQVVLDPAWLRIDLPVFFLSDGNDARVLVKHHEARAGCALIDGSDVIFQGMRLNCRVAGYYAMGATGEWKSSTKTRLAVKRKKPLLAVAL
jgi:hypothetical protein